MICLDEEQQGPEGWSSLLSGSGLGALPVIDVLGPDQHRQQLEDKDQPSPDVPGGRRRAEPPQGWEVVKEDTRK